MLLLNRKIGEKILIGENIILVVADVSRGRVRIGITAPEDVRIVRSELTHPDFPSSDATSTDSAGPNRGRDCSRNSGITDISNDNAPSTVHVLKRSPPRSRFVMA